MDIHGINFVETALVGALFLCQHLIWSWKSAVQRANTGSAPEVMARSEDPIQRYQHRVLVVLRLYLLLIAVLQILFSEQLLWARQVAPLDNSAGDVIGFVVGLLGLGVCGLAIHTMRDAWRVGIDEAVETDLIDRGIYRLILHPTYAGLLLFNLGLWLIWPSALVAIFCIVFFYFIEIQSRFEDQHLQRLHGRRYVDFAAGKKRYYPKLY